MTLSTVVAAVSQVPFGKTTDKFLLCFFMLQLNIYFGSIFYFFLVTVL